MTVNFNENAEKIWVYLIGKGFNAYGVAGLIGNLYAESGLRPNNLENAGNNRLGVTDEEYTANVNSKRYSKDKFIYDQCGYGLAQWTYHSRKAALWDFANASGKDIDDLYMQLDYLMKELQGGYKIVYNVLVNAKSIREASNSVVYNFERPQGYDTWETQNLRYEISQCFYNKFAVKTVVSNGVVKVSKPMLKIGNKGNSVKELQELLIKKGYSLAPYGADGDFGGVTYNAVIAFQRDNGLEVDGIVGDMTWAALTKEDATQQKQEETKVAYPTLQKGSVGNYVKQAQEKLIALGYSCGYCGADGDFGNDTYTAVLRFQKVNGLTQNGIIDSKTWEKLFSADAKKNETEKEGNTESIEGETYIERLIRVARGEVGYLEKASNSQLDDKTANAGYNNWNKYARDIDTKWPNFYNGKKNGYAWCDAYADWCFLTAFGYTNTLKLLYAPEHSLGAGCQYSANYYRQNGAFSRNNPQVGDQIFFGTYGQEGHIGIVIKVDANRVYTIEGNTSSASGVVANGGGVFEKSYPIGYSGISGYGHPNWKTLG